MEAIGSTNSVAQRPMRLTMWESLPPKPAVAVALGLPGRQIVLARAAAAVVDLDEPHAVDRSLALVVGEEPDVDPARVAGGGHRSAAVGGGQHVGQRVVDAGEVEAVDQVVVDPEDQHVAVVGLHLAGLEDQQAVAVLERPVVGAVVELAVLGEHEPLDG